MEESFFRRKATSSGSSMATTSVAATTGARGWEKPADFRQADQQQLRIGVAAPGNAGRPASVTRGP